VWRDLFSSELRDRFTLSRDLYWAALKDATESLDQGKGYVQEGLPGLRKPCLEPTASALSTSQLEERGPACDADARTPWAKR